MLRQGVNSLAQRLDTPAIRVRIPSGTWDFFFQTTHHLVFTNFHIRVKEGPY